MISHTITRVILSVSLMASVLVAAPAPASADIIPKKLKSLFSFNKEVNQEKIRKKQAKKVKTLQKKANKNTREMAELAEYYEQGFGVKRNRARALSLYQKAFAAGDAMAVYQMGEYTLGGLDIDGDGVNEVPRDPVRGRALMQKAAPGIAKLAKKDDGEALYLMGLFHRSGNWGFNKDRKKSRKFFKKGSDKKYPKAMYWYGEILLTEGRKKHPEACNKFLEGGILGYGRAAHAIGYCYDKGRGKPRNTKLAYRWYQYGADKRDIQSIIRMGDSYANKGNDKGKETAATYYDQAIAEGSAAGFAGYARHATSAKETYYYQQALSLSLNNKRYFEKVRAGRPKDSSGKDKIIGIAPGIYTSKDLTYIAGKAAQGHQGAAEYVKDFMLMGYIKSLAPVTLLTLNNGFPEFGQLLYFSPDNKTLKVAHEFGTYIGTQTIISNWDVKTNKLVSIRALKAGLDMLAASSSGTKLAMTDETYKYWQSRYDDEKNQLVVYDAETGKQSLFLLQAKGGGIYWKNVVFSGGDRYLSITERRLRDDITPYYSFVFDMQTGNKVTDDPYGDRKRIISPNGQHVITHETEHGKNRSDKPDVSYQRVPSWSVGSGIKDLTQGNGVFSPDQHYWVMPRTLFDIKAKTLLEEHGAARRGVAFRNIENKPLLVRFFNDGVVTYLMEGASIKKINTAYYNVKRNSSETHIFSPDYSLIATNGVRADNTLKETFIQSYEVPGEKLLAEKREELKAAASADEEMKDVLALFEAGFDDMAVEKFTEVVSKDPTQTGPLLELLERRADIDATLLGRAFKVAFELVDSRTDVFTIGAFYNDYEGGPGTGPAIIESFVMVNSPIENAGAKIGDRIISLDDRPVFAKQTAEMKKYRKSITAGQTIQMVLERGGRHVTINYTAQTVPSALGQQIAARYLFWYALIGNSAGHPEIAEMAADKMGIILNSSKYTRFERFSGNPIRQMSALLRSVAAASRGDMKTAFGLLLAEKAMKIKDGWGVLHVNWYPDFFADLHKEPKKLAYILGVKVDALPKVPEARVKPAPYWTLDGRLIEPGVAAILEEDGGAIID